MSQFLLSVKTKEKMMLKTKKKSSTMTKTPKLKTAKMTKKTRTPMRPRTRVVLLQANSRVPVLSLRRTIWLKLKTMRKISCCVPSAADRVVDLGKLFRYARPDV